jgi:hypothetical protein
MFEDMMCCIINRRLRSNEVHLRETTCRSVRARGLMGLASTNLVIGIVQPELYTY